ncbi:unnamed protein product [Dibothriocephalus latus]|uniref:BRCA2 OB1 domain-containing protein n=1 Tax=Dibothriocephalus latus TaxID=60516 RepID=A0A3P7L6V7_DIBLA|nr:unnamed protein product [Dibothriocephalus latus]
MTHVTIKSLIEAAIDSCEAIDIGSFFSKVNFKNTRPSSLNKPLFTPQDQISSPRVEKLRQTIQPPPSDVFTFSIPFVYPTAEDVYQQESAVLCNRKTPPSCTQAFEDNFESVNLTQMLDETRLYDFPNQVTGFCTGKGASISISSAAALQHAKGLVADCFNETSGEHMNRDLESMSATSAPQDLISDVFSPKICISIASTGKSLKLSDTCHVLPSEKRNAWVTGSLVADGGARSGLKSSDSRHFAKSIPEASAHEPVSGSSPKRIQPCVAPQSSPCSASLGSRKSTGFQTGKGASIAVKSTKALIRAKALFADCLNESVSELEKIPVHENSRNRLPVLKELQLAPDKSKALCATGLVKEKAGTTLLTTKQLCRPTGFVADSLIEPVGMQITESISPYKTPKAAAKEPTILKCQPLPDASSAPIITGFSTGKGASISITSAEVPQRVRELLKECLDEPLVDGCQQRNENCMTPPALNVSEANNNHVFDSYSNDKGSAISYSSVDAGNHPKYLVKEHVRESPTEKVTRRVDAQPTAEKEVKVSHSRDLSNRNTGFLTGSGGSVPVASDTRARPSSTEEANRSDFAVTDKLPTLHGIDAPPSSDSKLERAPQNARKFHSVLPSNTPSQGPISSVVLCAEAVELGFNTNFGSSSNGKIFLRAQPTVRSADAYTLSGTASLPPEEETGNEIPIRLQSPRFGNDEASTDVLEPNSLVVETNRGSPQCNVASPKATKDRALAREQQETMALAKFKSHAAPFPKTARSRAAGRTPLVGSVATSRGQPQKVVREPASPGLLWRLRHRLPTSSTFLNTCCLTEQVSLPNARLALPDCLELPKDISSWSLSTAGHLLFRLDSPDSAEYPLSYNLGDSVEVIPSESGLAGVDEVESCAILQPNCLRDSLAKFPVHAQFTLGPGGSTFLGCWLLHALLLELKYRYDRELEAVERSALRKILETDDTPAKRMVLCVSHLQPLQNAMYRGRLTDGWYHMDWLPDKVLAQLISRGKIRVGTKLVCAGAEAVQRPVGFDPPEGATAEVDKDADSHLFGPSSGLVLRLGANSTRIAHPTARLGYASSSGHMTSLCPIPLSSLYADGGPVSSILVLVQRRFQLQFMETRSEDSDGERKQRIFRDPRSEEAAAREHEKNCQLAFDKAAGDFSSPKRMH